MPSNQTLGENTYRRAYVGLWIAAGVLFGLLIGTGRRLWATAAFFLLAGAAVALRATYDGTLFDERDDEVHYRASGHTITLYGLLSAVVFPTLVALEALGMYEWGTVASAAAWAVGVLYITYAAMTVLVGRKR